MKKKPIAKYQNLSHREMEITPEPNPPAEEWEVHFRMSTPSHFYLNMTENFPEPVESFKIGEGNT